MSITDPWNHGFRHPQFRPPHVYIHREEGTYHFHEDGPDHGYQFVSLGRPTETATLFKNLRPEEQDAGWVAFDEWKGKFRETRR